MDYLSLFLPSDLALLSDWLKETGELYCDIYLPHSGGGGNPYFLHSLKDLKSLVSQQTHPEIEISIFHHLQYPIRGIANESLLKQALAQIPDGEWYSIVSLSAVYPSSVSWRGSGNNHKELQSDFSEVLSEKVGIGQNPFDIHANDWFRTHPNEVFQVSVSKTRHYHEPYAREPEKYQWVFEMWQE